MNAEITTNIKNFVLYFVEMLAGKRLNDIRTVFMFQGIRRIKTSIKSVEWFNSLMLNFPFLL